MLLHKRGNLKIDLMNIFNNKNIVYLFLFIFPFQGFAQQFKTIQGRVFSQNDSIPLYNAHIYLVNKNLGTTSNEEGWFKINVPNNLTEETVVVSFTGYSNFLIDLSENLKDTSYIYLFPSITTLGEVTITAIDGKEIVKRAIEKMPINYPQVDILSDLHYKEILKIDSSYVRYLEIAADFVTKGFDNKKVGRENYKDVFIKGKRASYNYDSAYNGENGLFIVYWLNWARGFLTKGALRECQYEYEGTTTYNGNNVYKIASKRPNSSASALLYISPDDYAVVAIVSYLNNDNQKQPKGNEKWWFLKLQLHVDFRKVEGLWYINSIDDHRVSLHTNGRMHESRRSIRVLDVKNTRKLPLAHKIKPETDLFNYPINYDPQFWRTYNAPLETEEEIRIKKKLERNRINLIDQFKK